MTSPFRSASRIAVAAVVAAGLSLAPQAASAQGLIRDTEIEEILARDARDAQRTVAPLKPADDAVLIDTTGLSIGEVVDRVLALVPARSD